MSPGGVGPTYLFADLHLRPEDPEAARRFAGVLEGRRPGDRLFLLGDLFDVWLGRRSLREAGYAPFFEGLARARARGVEIEALLGNRDFLLDGAFEERTGVRLRGEERVVDLAGRRALLLHGDTLCTRDRAYQRYRGLVRSGLARALARALPTAAVRAFAGGLRRSSARAVAAKPTAVKAIVPEAAARAAAARGCGLVVCGHAHALRVERVGEATLLVLPAWEEGGEGVAEAGGALRRIGPDGAAGEVLLPSP